MSYRPEGWNTVLTWAFNAALEKRVKEAGISVLFDRDYGEAGADAMLEALKARGICFDSNGHPMRSTYAETISLLDNCKDGWLIFIEDKP